MPTSANSTSDHTTVFSDVEHDADRHDSDEEFDGEGGGDSGCDPKPVARAK